MSKRKTEHLARLLAGLPEVKAIMAREEANERNEAVQARMACIERLNELRDAEDKAHAEHKSATTKLEEARQVFRQVELEAFQAYEAWSATAGMRRHVEDQLNREHGEGAIAHADYLLDTIKRQQRERLQALEACRYAHGLAGYLRERPEVVARIHAHKEQMQITDEAHLSIKSMYCASLTAQEIAEQVKRILDGTGLFEQPKPATVDE